MSVADAAADREQILIPIKGMSCSTCAGRIEKALSALPGVQASVNLSTEQADIDFAPARANVSALAQAIEGAGYEVPHETRELTVYGMTCATCAARVEGALKHVRGITRAEVNVASEKAMVQGIRGLSHPADLIAALRKAGTTPSC